MISPAVLDAMVQAGCTAEQIAAAVKADMAEGEARREAKRANNAERQRRYRERHKDDVMESNADNALQGVTNGDPSLSLPPNEKISNPPTHTHPDNTTPRARKAHRLPADWVPKPLPAELAADVAKWPSGAIERELARFRDWAASAPNRSGLKSDWDATWRNWLRRKVEEGTYRNDRTNQNRPRDGVAAALDRRIEQPSRPADGQPACLPGSDGGGTVAYLAAVR